MNKALITAYFMLFSILYVQSQNFTISGKVVDATTKDVLEYATVTFKPKGSSELIGGITNKKGKFEISVPKGKYTITVEFLSYKSKIFKSQDIKNDVHFGSIELSEDTEFLDDVVVIGEKKTIEIKPKKLVYNVSKDIASEGTMVSDILNNVPSVTVESDIPTIRGQKATIMVNGKTSSLSKGDALKSLPSGSVERIEVITHPGAQYKASYGSIINIILKKGKDEGLNASITAQIGSKDIYGGLLTLNNKTKKVNFFTNTSFSHRDKIRTSNSENEYFSGGSTTSFLNEDSKYSNKKNGLITTIGADFYLSKNTTLTTSVNYTKLNYDSKTRTNSSILDAAMIETSFNEREHLGDFEDEIVELIAEFEHQFTKEGRTLSSSITYTNDVESNKDGVTNTNISYTNESYAQENKLLNTEFDIKYTSPITEKTSLTIGYNGGFGKVPFRNSTPNKNIDYAEDVHSAFGQYAYESDKFYVEIVLRGEFAKTTTDYLDLDISQKRTLNDFFPSSYMQYAINDAKTISLSYSKGIGRVVPSQLQPFEEKYSETSSYIGNENLKPLYIDSYGLDYTYSTDKLMLIPALFYNKYNDWWQTITYETGEQIDGINKLITTPQNVGYVNYYGASLTASYKVSNQLNFTFDTTLYNFDQHGIFETINMVSQPISIDYNKKSFNGNFKLLTQLKFPKIVNIQTNISHFLKSEGPVSTRKAYTYASLAMNKDLLDKKATVSLSINDVFNSKETNRDRFSDNYFSNSIIKDKPDIVLSFTYRFNQSKSNRKIILDKKDKKPNF